MVNSFNISNNGDVYGESFHSGYLESNYKAENYCVQSIKKKRKRIYENTEVDVQTGAVKTVTAESKISEKLPESYQIDDKYIDIILNNPKNTRILVNVTQLKDNYIAGAGIEVENNVIKIDENVTALKSDLAEFVSVEDIAGKQDALVSGTSIKTVNNTSLLGSGDVAVQEILVSGTNIKTINSISLLGSGDIEAAKIDGSNMSSSVKNIDGSFVGVNSTIGAIASGVSMSTSSKTYDISTILPDDNYNYEVWLSCALVTGSTSGNRTFVAIGSDISRGLQACRARTVAASSVYAGGSIVLPVGTNRTIIVLGNTNANGTYDIDLIGYRRIGTNS